MHLVNAGDYKMKGVAFILSRHRKMLSIKRGNAHDLVVNLKYPEALYKGYSRRCAMRVSPSHFLQHDFRHKRVKPWQFAFPPPTCQQIPGVNNWVISLRKVIT